MNRSAVPTTQPATKSIAPVQGVLQRKCDCGNHTVAGGECVKCGKNRLRRKVLTVNAPNDIFEHEADRAAEQLMRGGNVNVSSAAGPLQRCSSDAGGLTETSSLLVNEVLNSPGNPLDGHVRAFMEPRFGRDFSSVRVHTDSQAAESARTMGALAYTSGRHVVFGAGAYAPQISEGMGLLAHELTHVVQQGTDQTVHRKMLQFKGGTIGGFFSNLGRSIVSIFGDESGFSDTTLQQYLTVLDAGNIEDDYNSDDKARIVVRRWLANASGFTLSQQRKVLLIQEMISGFTGDADEAAILDLLAGSSDSEVTFILGKVTPDVLRGEIHGAERKQLERILSGWTARQGTIPAQDIFSGTQPVTATQGANVEHVLNPTTTLVPSAPVAPGVAPPPPVVVDPPAMTGTGPGGTFETEMLAMFNSNIGGWATDFRTLRAESGQPAFPVVSANRIADAAQGEAERHFSPYIRVASRGIADVYHPGAYSLTSKLGDESTRPVTDALRRGWLNYWMTLRAPNCRAVPCGQGILDSHSYLGSRDSAELIRVRDLYMSAPANVTDIDDTIHSWPAEAGSGTVFIQPYQRIPDEDAKRKQRWELFTTLIHEMMHVLMHPNFAAAANIIGGTARKILVEGFAEVMRTELWSGAGSLRSRLAGSETAPLRRQVEGKQYDYKDSVIKDAGYYDQLADASRIDTKVGHENAKSAFFLGHVELLGLGAGTRTESGSLAGVAMYSPSDVADAQVIVAGAGDNYAGLLARSGASAGGLLDDATGVVLPVGAAIAPGTRVRIPGIRWIRAITNDTLGSVAQQHHVTVSALAAANGFPAGAPAATPLITSNRILIPIHPSLP